MKLKEGSVIGKDYLGVCCLLLLFSHNQGRASSMGWLVMLIVIMCVCVCVCEGHKAVSVRLECISRRDLFS